MAYFPSSLMPSKVKSEAADVDGNRFILSGDDHNRLDEEIRAIEKMLLGVQTGGGGSSGTVANCSSLVVLLAIAQQLQTIRDSMVDSTSGIVAVKDGSVPLVDGIIPFPAAWHTTLVTGIADDSTSDEAVLPAISEITLSSVSGFPNEGYITIINDVSFGNSYVPHLSNVEMYSPIKANAKVGEELFFDILFTGNPTITVTGLPEGLSFSQQMITGIPTTAGESTAKITAKSGSETKTFSLTITVFDTNTPAITEYGSTTPVVSLTASATVNQKFEYTIGFIGGVTSIITAAALPDGLTRYGNIITGTPRIAGTYSIDIQALDDFGGSGSATLVLTVVSPTQG